MTRRQHDVTTTGQHGDAKTRNKMTTIMHSNIPPRKKGRHAYGFNTSSYDPYTKHNDEDYHRF